jgi:hypothetical protein
MVETRETRGPGEYFFYRKPEFDHLGQVSMISMLDNVIDLQIRHEVACSEFR